METQRKLKLKILLCQTDCLFGKTLENIERWEEKLEKYTEKD